MGRSPTSTGPTRTDHPNLQEVQAGLDVIADAHGGGGRTPKGRKPQAHDPHVDIFVQRCAFRRRSGRLVGVAWDIAGGPICLEAVAHQRADVGRVCGLDAEATHGPRLQVERDVVLLRAQHRLGAVGHTDGETVVAAGADSDGELAHRGALAVAERLGTTAVVFPGGHGGFLGGEYGQMGEPEAFAVRLREVLAAEA